MWIQLPMSPAVSASSINNSRECKHPFPESMPAGLFYSDGLCDHIGFSLNFSQVHGFGHHTIYGFTMVSDSGWGKRYFGHIMIV